MEEVRGRSPQQPAFGVTLSDDSMLPRYRRGAVLRVDPGIKAAIGDEVCVAAGPSGALVIGVLVARNGPGVTLRQYANPKEFALEPSILVGRILPLEEGLL